MTDLLPTLLLTRPRGQSEEFADRCRKEIRPDLPVLIAPILGIETMQPSRRLDRYGFLIFSSANAVRAVTGAPELSGRLAYCVGDRTAAAASAAGACAVSAEGSADDLVRRILKDAPEGPGLWLRGRHAASDIADELSRAGLPTTSEVVYDQVPLPLSAEAYRLLAGAGAGAVGVVVPLFSPRSARLLSGELAGAVTPVLAVALSDQIATEWFGPGGIAKLAAAPTADAMIAAIAACYPGRPAC